MKPLCTCGECSLCKHRETNRAWRERNRAHEAARHRAYHAAHREQVANANRRWRELNPEKDHAHKIVNRQVAAGNLNAEPCEVCGDPRTQAHHDDYSRPLDVRWLCQKHHSEIHWISEVAA